MLKFRFFISNYLFLFLFLCLISCDKLAQEYVYDMNSVFDTEVEYNRVSTNFVLDRAYKMATVEWIPKGSVPANGGLSYESGRLVTGVPYSSVKEINTYLFLDVTYHTFITAVNNPFSVLYTENLSEFPYHGVNCATYYGSVCSSSIMWVFDINIPYYANQIKDLSCLEKIENANIDSLKLCDIIWQPGHVQMVYSFGYENGVLSSITTFESAGLVAHFSTYSIDDFNEKWNDENYVIYRYKYLNYSSEPTNPNKFESVEINNALCPTKGERAVYRTDDDIIINIFQSGHDEIVLYRDGMEIRRDKISRNIHQYSNLMAGSYSVVLDSRSNCSNPIEFEVIDIDVNYTINKHKNNLDIYFKSSGIPEFVALCTVTGNSIYFPITEDSRMKGYVTVPKLDENEYYCKVIFRGKFGRIINKPIRVI